MSEAWWAAIIGAVPGVGGFAWAAWQWYFTRIDKREEFQTTREERLQRDLDARAAALSTEHAKLLAQIQEELIRSETRRLECDQRANDWEFLARWWTDGDWTCSACSATWGTILTGCCIGSA